MWGGKTSCGSGSFSSRGGSFMMISPFVGSGSIFVRESMRHPDTFIMFLRCFYSTFSQLIFEESHSIFAKNFFDFFSRHRCLALVSNICLTSRLAYIGRSKSRHLFASSVQHRARHEISRRREEAQKETTSSSN